MIRPIAALAGLALLVACTDATRDLADPVIQLGDFKLGHAGVVAPAPEKLLVSREATSEELIAVVDTAIEERFRRFDGDKFYHLGISVEAYSLPPPVVPGKSALALRVTVWDDAAQAKLDEETKLITVIKVFESRLTMTREDQLQGLAEDAARQIEDWLRDQNESEGWFVPDPDAAPEVPAEDAAKDAPEAPGDASPEDAIDEDAVKDAA